MPILRSTEAPVTRVKEGVQRTLIYGNHLMTAVIEFTNGPWDEPDVPHHHVHEQITYVAAGELIFFCEGEPEQRLKAGDMFFVPSGRSHTVQLLTKTVRLVDSFNPVRKDFLPS
jgi:quercetin dioxygenase-like cupin family protein